MQPRLYALKEDLDMVIQDVTRLKLVYKPIDTIAGRFNDLWREQVIQGEQMKRMDKKLDLICKNLNISTNDII